MFYGIPLTAVAAWCQGREMRKYTAPQPRRPTGMTADYLEAEEAESDYEDDGMTPSDRARHFLSRDRLDEDAEVSECSHYAVDNIQFLQPTKHEV